MKTQVEITEGEWRRICHNAQSQTINTRFKLIQFQGIMCTYTHSWLHRSDNHNPDLCIKCGQEEGMLFHCLWSCPQMKKNILGKDHTNYIWYYPHRVACLPPDIYPWTTPTWVNTDRRKQEDHSFMLSLAKHYCIYLTEHWGTDC